MPTSITSKHEMYRRLNAGWLGHTLPAVETIEELQTFLQEGVLYAIRLKQAGSRTKYHLTKQQVLDGVNGLPKDGWNVTPMLSDAHRVCYAHLLDTLGVGTFTTLLIRNHVS